MSIYVFYQLLFKKMENKKNDYPFMDKKKLKKEYTRIIKNPDIGKNLRRLTKMYLEQGVEALKSLYLNGKQSGFTAYQLRNSLLTRYLNLIEKMGMNDNYRDMLYLLCYSSNEI
jgi:hypothetical protein